MSEWKTVTLGEKAKEITVGFVGPMASEYVEKGIPFLRSQNVIPFSIDYDGIKYISEEFHKKLKKSALTPGDVVIVRTGKPGASVVIPESLPVVNCSDLVIVRCGDKLDPNFVSYYINSITKSHVDANLVGAVQQHFNVGAAKQILIPDINIDHQRSIASILTSLDNKIDLLHRQNATLEAMAETLFRQWFVVEAKEDWAEGKLPDEFDCIMGASPPGESYNEEGIGISMFQGNADFEFRFPKKRVYTTDPKRFAEKFDTLISVRAPVGEQNMASERCCIGRGVAAFRYKANNDFYTYTYFKMESIMEEIKQFNETGTVFGSISKSDFENLNIVIPDKATVIKFQNEVKPIDDKIISNCTQIRTLTALRDTLLPKLMSGEVRVEM